jgi:hypothetical protein
MKDVESTLARLLLLVALLVCLPTVQAFAKDPAKKSSSQAAMHLHHMHTMLNHGLTMALQGSNLVMLSEMKMAPGVDEITLSHGKKMLADGKAMIKDTLEGKDMRRMHGKGAAGANSELMAYTHSLGAAMLAVVSDIENMNMGEMTSQDAMKMHHMHIALNHALEMAAEGNNLVMLGQMKMAKGTDTHSVAHGRDMIAQAQKLWQEVMESQAMSAMHLAGATPEGSAAMGGTHKLASDGKKVLDMLAEMPAAT